MSDQLPKTRIEQDWQEFCAGTIDLTPDHPRYDSMLSAFVVGYVRAARRMRDADSAEGECQVIHGEAKDFLTDNQLPDGED